ncbi:MAG: sulfotransferase [Pseudomonadota bacterium]
MQGGAPSDSSQLPPFPVVVGVPRSGTTLLRMMLDSHSELAIPPETGFLLDDRIAGSSLGGREIAREMTEFPREAPAWSDFGISADEFLDQAEALSSEAGPGDVLRLFYRMYATNHGKRRAGDKTPGYVNAMSTIARLMPETRFIHIIRDGRDVALSWRKTWFAPSADIPTLVRTWTDTILGARESAARLHYREVFYSDLVRDPAAVLRDICDFVDLRYEPSMLRYYTRSPQRLREHRARYRMDGTLVVSHDTRIVQQQNTMKPILPRDGVWRREMEPHDLSRIDPLSTSLLDEIARTSRLP